MLSVGRAVPAKKRCCSGWGSYVSDEMLADLSSYAIKIIQSLSGAECHKGPPELSSSEWPLFLAAGSRGTPILRQSLDVDEELESSCLLYAHQEPQVDRGAWRQRRYKGDCAGRKRRVEAASVWLPTPCNFERRALHRDSAWRHGRGARRHVVDTRDDH